MKDYFGLQGKKVVITGAASGMGFATAEMLVDLGAEVYALDVREVDLPVAKYISTNMLKKESIDATLAQLPEKIDVVISCAGIPGAHYKGSSFTEADVYTINFIAPRYLIEQLLPRMEYGGSIGIIASVAALGWENALDDIAPLLEAGTFEEARGWLDSHPDSPLLGVQSGYQHSKKMLVVYAKARAEELSHKGIRINCISPGSTQTGMTADFVAQGSEARNMSIVTGIGRRSTPEEMAGPLVFLCSTMAGYVSGVDLQVDYGYTAYASTALVDLPPLE